MNRRTKGPPSTPEEMFYWLYCLKDKINKDRKPSIPSIPFGELTTKYQYHGGLVDDIALGDTLMIFALGALACEKQAIFVDMCHVLSRLLPLPDDSELCMHLKRIRPSSIPIGVLKCARAARIERGFPTFDMAHYKELIDE